MKKITLLCTAAVVALGLFTATTAKADFVDDIKWNGSTGFQTRHFYRGVEDNRETPVLFATGTVRYEFVRLGVDLRTLSTDSDTANLKWNGHGEVFHTILGHEVKLGLGTDEVANSSTETYVGLNGPVFAPWGLSYDLLVSRSNQLGDVWVEGGVSKKFDALTLRGGIAGGFYDKSGLPDGTEYLKASADYKLTAIPHFEKAVVNLAVIHAVDDGYVVRGIQGTGDTFVTGGLTFNF